MTNKHKEDYLADLHLRLRAIGIRKPAHCKYDATTTLMQCKKKKDEM
jgi:hypothetical protein